MPNLQIQHNLQCISNATQTKFLGLLLDDTLTWSCHTDLVTKKMSSISYALRQAKHTLPLTTLKVIYFAHVHSIISYGIIFWGNSPSAIKVFKLQKKIVRIIANIKPRDSCREVFKKMQILPLSSQYIYSLMLFVANNKYLFTANNDIHEYNTRNNNNLHPAHSNLTKFNKGPSISGIKAFNHLPHYLKVPTSL
jgi:hypothetical protein